MKNMHKFLNIKYITLFVIIAMLTIASVIMFTGTTGANEESETLMLSKDMLNNLLIGPEDLPWDVILFNLDISHPGATKKSINEFGNQSSVYNTGWSGRHIDNGSDKLSTSESNIKISAAITDSPEAAADIAYNVANSYSIPLKEVTNDEYISTFADRAWGVSSNDTNFCLGARLLYIRGNLICDISLSRLNYFEPRLLFDLVSILNRKIDAALAGKPEPVPILPLAATYGLGGNVNSAFKMRSLGSRLWGNESINIALRDENGIPRLIPAKQTADGDYLVTLRHLVAVIGIGSITSADIKKDNDLVVYGAEFNHMGKSFDLSINSSEMKAGDETIQLNHPVEFRENEIIVPLKSVVQEGLGKNISWEKRGEVMIGKMN